MTAKKATRCFAAVGGSSATWKYDDSFSVEQCLLFNTNVQRLRDGFKAKNVESISGASELQGIQLGDKIGHVSSASESIVFDAFVNWVRRSHDIVPVAVPVVAGSELASLPAVRGDSSALVDSAQPVANPVTEQDTSRPFALCQWIGGSSGSSWHS